MKYYQICFIAFVCTAITSTSHAFNDVGFSRTCRAPNWNAPHIVNIVPEMNVSFIEGGYIGFAGRAPNGGWLIRWDVGKMMQLPRTFRRFAFYHECAHAQFNTASEFVADCEGLRAMADDIGVTETDVAVLSDVYARLDGRAFPPKGCSF